MTALLLIIAAGASGFVRTTTMRCPRGLLSAEKEESLLSRFTNPRIDDEGLVIADALIAGVIAPGLEAIVCTLVGAPLPTWATAFGRGKLVAPVVVRGINLGGCWLGGALAARCYERSAYDFPPPAGATDRYEVTARRVVQAGSFATALLLLSTQLNVALNFGLGTRFGDDPTVDAQLAKLADDVVRDVGTEAIVLLSWRLARTSLSRLD